MASRPCSRSCELTLHPPRTRPRLLLSRPSSRDARASFPASARVSSSAPCPLHPLPPLSPLRLRLARFRRYASRSADDVLLRSEIDAAAAANPARLTVRHVVARAPESGDSPSGGPSTGTLDAETLRASLPSPDAEGSLVLVCGPERLVRGLCGERARDGGAAPEKRLGGVLKQLGYRDEQVCWL